MFTQKLKGKKTNVPLNRRGISSTTGKTPFGFKSGMPPFLKKLCEKTKSIPLSVHKNGTGLRHAASAFGSTVRLEGRTDADFNGGSFQTVNTRVRPATGCEGCSGDDCVRVTGTLVVRYHVTTTVTLPRVSDYPGLTACQRRRVRHAIRTVLAPHERQHVRAFRRYNGVTRRHFDLTLCRSEFDSTIQSMVDSEETARRRAARAASDALDPFHFDVDLDCED
jgi:hypothetical protein